MIASNSTTKLPMSLVVITLNEEKNLKRCLDSAPWFEDIIVLDSGSSDRTLEIARSHGARIFTEAWKGFGPQKKRAVDLAKYDWVLCVDADEAISPELGKEIQDLFPHLDSSTGYRLSRKSFYLGRWILHGGWFPDYQLRLFHRQYMQWDQALIHEKVQSLAQRTKIQTLQCPLEHYVFQDVAHHVATNNRYSSLQAEQYLSRGGAFSLGKMLVKPVSKFLECYLWKAGFLDGLPGFIIAVGASYSVFIPLGENRAKIDARKCGEKVKINAIAFSVLMTFTVFAQEKTHVLFPSVAQLNGSVDLVGKDGKVEKLKKNSILRERAHLVSKSKSQVRLELDGKTSLTILENSEVDIPFITWENNEISEIHLLRGSVRVDTVGPNERLYTTPVTHEVYTDADFVLTYDPSLGKATLSVFRGALDFRGQEGEVTARVGSGERAYFQGILENGSPSFDVLLRGRKVARGSLGPVEKISQNELTKMEQSSLVRKPVVVKKVVTVLRAADQICEDPYAKLNECVWTCEGMPKKLPKQITSCDVRLHGVECLRRRCDANGKWTDPLKVPVSEGRCQLQAVVAPCDY